MATTTMKLKSTEQIQMEEHWIISLHNTERKIAWAILTHQALDSQFQQFWH